MAKYKYIYNFATFSSIFNAILAFVKILAGMFTGSIFLILNALYNIGIGVSKYLTITTSKHIKYKNKKDQTIESYKTYNIIGIIIITINVIYLIYSVYIFLGLSKISYHMYVAIGIAAVTFSEITISIIGIIKTRRMNDPLKESLKFVNLASSLISLVLTQTAILSFVDNTINNSLYNGISAIAFGSISLLIGVYMLIHSYKRTHEKEIK